MAPLGQYTRKRNFGVTSEPVGRVAAKKGHSFVIQKHAARRLHYDFRLELDGVLKSWAVPKGPCLDPKVKRLAVEVEDHPVSYGSFEGTIPQGEYGGGSVLVWDRGTWEPLEDPHKGLKKGHLRFSLDGEKLHGEWNLVRTRSSGGKQQWLLIKHGDEAARPESEYDIEAERPESVVTGVEIEQVAGLTDKKGRLQADRVPRTAARRAAPGTRPKTRSKAASRKSEPAPASEPEPEPSPAPVEAASRNGEDPLPDFVSPQLALLTSEAPTNPSYVHEIKFDGYRILSRLDYRGESPVVNLITRNHNDWTETFPTIAEAIASLDVESAMLDGEVVAEDAQGRSNFQRLQNALSGAHPDELRYYVFDLLYLNGHDLREQPLLERKQLLAALLKHNPHPLLRYSEHWSGDAGKRLKELCKRGMEGIVCKDGSMPYESTRSSSWLKVKCTNRQEFVIVGYTGPRGTRQHIGALLMAAHDEDGRLRYVGRVGTGMTQKVLGALKKKLAGLETDTPPVFNPERSRDVTWVKPRLVAEVEFGHLTDDQILRHASFQGLRADKPAEQVYLEVPRMVEESPGPAKHSSKNSSKKPSQNPPEERLTLTHPDKVLFTPDGPTKQELADYYVQIAERMWPYIEGHPLVLLRCPSGQEKQCFFQKHIVHNSVEPGIAGVDISEKSESQPYRYLESPLGLQTLVQLGALEIHIWGSRIADLEHPVELVFDLDPDPSVTWKRVVDGTHLVRDLLQKLGLRSFLKLSGGKGVHLHVPIAPRYGWEEAKDFCHAVARQLAEEQPELFTAELAKKERVGKIFVDYLRNGRGATYIAPFSARARAGAPIAAPISWAGLDGKTRPDAYTVRTIGKYLRDYPRDPWTGYFKLSQRIRLLDRRKPD